MLKNIISILTVVCMTFIGFTGCTTDKIDSTSSSQIESQQSDDTSKSTEGSQINIAALKGPTAMGMVKLMDNSENGKSSNSYNFSIAATADEIVAKIAKGDLDIAAVPANLSSVLYNNTDGKISVAAINTLGVLYIVQTINNDSVKQIESIQDLKGSSIMTTGKGTTPEYVLNYILTSNGIDIQKDVNIDFKSEATEIVSNMALSSTASSIAVLPEPFVTTAQSKNPNLNVVLDLTQEWDKLQTDENNKSSMITGVVIANNEFIKNNAEAFDKFLDEYKISTDYINSNIEDGALLVEKYGIVPAEIAQKAIPKCNITFIDGEDMHKKLAGYLKILFEQNPKSVGGALPDEAFYYKR